MEDCPICYDAVDKSTGHCTLACNHSFHINCLTTWSAKEPTCPLCRHELGEKEVAVKRAKPEPWGWLGENVIEDDGVIVSEVTQPTIHIGDGVEVTEADVQEVMHVGPATRGEAIRALRRYHGSVDLAVDEILSPFRPHRMVPAPRYPLDEPSEDQTIAWALHRMFDETYTTYKWNSYSDMRSRTRPYFYGSDYWRNKDIHDMANDGMVSAGYESA
jgi:Ring finger domain